MALVCVCIHAVFAISLCDQIIYAHQICSHIEQLMFMLLLAYMKELVRMLQLAPYRYTGTFDSFSPNCCITIIFFKHLAIILGIC